jgi:hypothetical protein
VIELYEKERERSEQSVIYIFAREDGSEKMINIMRYKADLNSILRIVGKHRARKFASEVAF